jgi:hypothetical protein
METSSEHVFISYVREDSRRVDDLQRHLESAGIPVWRDKKDLYPGDDWLRRIRHAITNGAVAFISCFSMQSNARAKSVQNDEILTAIEQLRLRPPDDRFLIPVRFDECPVPDFDLGGGRTLAAIQYADLFGDGRVEAMDRLVASLLRHFGKPDYQKYGHVADDLGVYLDYSGPPPPEIERRKYYLSLHAQQLAERGDFVAAAKIKIENADICRSQRKDRDAHNLEVSARGFIDEAAHRGQYCEAAEALRDWASRLRADGFESDAHLLEVTASQYQWRCLNP